MSAGWVHERGPESTPPPQPPDVHALQSYFFDPDSKEWIRTVLAPMGRELAARWQGAHRIPDSGLTTAPAAEPAPPPTGSRVGLVFAIVVLLTLSGAGVFASQSNLFTVVSAAPMVVATIAPAATPSPAADPVATEPAAPVTSEPVAAVTNASATPRVPPVIVPAGPRTTLPEGTVIVYTGPTSVSRGGFLPASFSVIAPNGGPASGDLTIVLGDLQRDPRLVNGSLDARGKIALDVPATLPVGSYALSIVYKGSRAFLATVVVR